MLLPNKATLDRMRQCYPAGTRVRLHHMGDPLAPPPGTLGTVEGIDDAGNILVLWDNGSTLNVVYGVDYCQPVNRAVYIPLPAERKDEILCNALEYIVELAAHNDLYTTLRKCLHLSDEEIIALGIEVETL